MAKAIGWYVHYTVEGYQQKGNNPPWSNGKYTPFKSQRGRIKSRAKSLVSRTALREGDIELLEELYSTKNFPLADITNAAGRTGEQEIRDSLARQMGQAAYQFAMDFNKGIATARMKSQSDTAYVDLGKAIHSFWTVINSAIAGRQIKNGFSIQDIQKRLQALKERWKDLSKEYQDYLKTARNREISGKARQITGSGTRGINLKLKSIRDDLIQIVKDYNLGVIGDDPQMIGAFYEHFIALAPLFTTFAGQTISDELQQALGSNPQRGTKVGSKHEGTYFDNSRFEQHINTRIGRANISTDARQSGSSQKKVDVIITWRDKPLNISAKNYNLNNPRSSVHLVSGSPLDFLLQDLNIDFVNHFLNIFSKHGKDKEDTKAQNLVRRELRIRMKQEIVYILLYKAITGDNYKRTPAQIFIVNNSSTGQAYAYTPQMLLDQLTDMDIEITDEKEQDLFGGAIEPIFKNRKGKTIYTRIESVLTEMHAKKITVAVRGSALIKKP